MADAMEVSLLSFISTCAGASWGLTDSQIALIASTVFVGVLIGNLFWGPFADKYGRRWAFILGILFVATSLECPEVCFCRLWNNNHRWFFERVGTKLRVTISISYSLWIRRGVMATKYEFTHPSSLCGVYLSVCLAMQGQHHPLRLAGRVSPEQSSRKIPHIH